MAEYFTRYLFILMAASAMLLICLYVRWFRTKPLFVNTFYQFAFLPVWLNSRSCFRNNTFGETACFIFLFFLVFIFGSLNTVFDFYKISAEDISGRLVSSGLFRTADDAKNGNNEDAAGEKMKFTSDVYGITLILKKNCLNFIFPSGQVKNADRRKIVRELLRILTV